MIERVPDRALRAAIRVNCARRLVRERAGGRRRQSAFVDELRRSAIAEQPARPNEQHYEVPAEFFRLVLGPRMKYSCCYWPAGVETLAGAEEAMLSLTCERARVEDGMDVLDLGCGWGSLTFWLAERYPRSRILAVSNSRTQRGWIEARRPANVEVVTADANVFAPARRFDRVLSVEMLEHVRNYPALFARIASWLEPGGRFFCHVFSHRRFAYPYTTSWLARRFFTAGTMPSHDLFLAFADDLRLEERWALDGTHYARSAEAWLRRLDESRADAQAVLDGSRRRLAEWHVFLLACAELWGYRGGREWGVSHYLFAPRKPPPGP